MYSIFEENKYCYFNRIFNEQKTAEKKLVLKSLQKVIQTSVPIEHVEP